MSEAAPTREIELSAHSLEIGACPMRYYYYRVLHRKVVFPQAARVAGQAMHAALNALDTGKEVAAQEAEVGKTLAKFAKHLDAEDYRSAAYLNDGLAAYRAEHPKPWWDEIVESEREFRTELGVVGDLRVWWKGRRDRLVRKGGGLYVVDYKTASRDRSVDWALAQNGDQLIGYAWEAQVRYGEPVLGAQLRRLILRPPSRKGKGVLYEFPSDAVIHFSQAQIAAWRENTLTLAKELANRDPGDPRQWPEVHALCGNRYGKRCDYHETCLMPWAMRLVHLQTDLYEDSRKRDDEQPPAE